MVDTIHAIQKIAPKEVDVLIRRYTVLNGILLFEPIGRRSLSAKLNVSEKTIRLDTEYFRQEGYILVSSTGMTITKYGIELLDALDNLMKSLQGITADEEIVKKILGCKEVTIVQGDADVSEDTRVLIGSKGAKVLDNLIQEDSVISLSGGSTVSYIIEKFKPRHNMGKKVMVVPSRGSLGKTVEFQSNTLVAMLAKKLNCRYKLLSLPDNLSRQALESVSQEPEIQKTIKYILKSTITVFGIGNAYEMAKRRKLSKDILTILREKDAVAETLGNYINRSGEIVYISQSIGVSIDQMEDLQYSIAVAGGASKAEAILAMRHFLTKSHIIIDEGAAKRIIELLR